MAYEMGEKGLLNKEDDIKNHIQKASEKWLHH